MSTVTAVIAAAGASSRMGFDKLSYRLGAHTVLEQSVLAMDRCPEITSLVLVCSASGQCAAEAATCLCQKPVRIVRGGATRAQSVRAGVLAADGEYVAIHDAARPFVSGAVVRAAVCAAQRCGAAAPAVPVKDTIKIVQSTAAGEQDLLVEKTPDRSTLYAVQTPQCFLRSAYLEALGRLSPEKADLVTDDCSLFELAGLPVQLVPGDYANCKITTREDLAPFAAKETAGMHIGHGYDVHRLVEGRPLILGGVEIPFEKGLLGHSDADVLTHAVMDAVLGAAAQGDIGQHFPDTDPAYAGADSLALARAVAALTTQKGWRIVNLDATILCQRPKLAESIPQMRANLAEAFDLSFEDVSVKATTEEHLGFTGEGLGIAAHAVALLEKL